VTAKYKTYGEHDPVTAAIKEKIAQATAGYPVGACAIAMMEMIMHHARQPLATAEYRAMIADYFALASVEIQQGDKLHRTRSIIVT
jgi:hypothetical protein